MSDPTKAPSIVAPVSTSYGCASCGRPSSTMDMKIRARYQVEPVASPEWKTVGDEWLTCPCGRSGRWEDLAAVASGAGDVS